MPPASPPSDQQNATDENSPLSDEDVAILYEIITCAEKDSSVHAHPFRSIFTAYDNVLARHGLDPDHDQIYLRFLLRLGEKRQIGETLYQSFELLLAELGIQIEINPEENEIQDVTRSLNAAIDNSPQPHTRSETGSDTGLRSRRASFHSLTHRRDEVVETARVRSSPRASVTDNQRDQIMLPRHRPSTRASTRPSERTGQRSLSAQYAPHPARGRLSASEFADNLQHYQRRNASASSTRTTAQRDHSVFNRNPGARSAQRPLIQPEVSPPSPGFGSGESVSEEEQSEVEFDRQKRRTERPKQLYHVDRRELYYRPTETQLVRDAETFQHFRIRALMRVSIGRWRRIALQSKQEHDQMAQIALSHDFGILLRQSFDQWRSNLQQRVETAIAEQYFFQLEQRAERARDLYLLMKAYTHWQQLARDRVEHALEARRQVLRVKYFHAWFDFTIQNNEKVRRQGLRKLCSLWIQRHHVLVGNDQKALFTRTRNLIKGGYWKWFWTFYERRAPQWKERRLQSCVLSNWALASRRRTCDDYRVTVQMHASVKRKWFSKWIQQARSFLCNSKEADRFRQQRITAQCMLECRRMVRYAPLVRQISNLTDWRIAGSTFGIFVNKSRSEQLANKVSHRRIMRNAWTIWNDNLRWQTLESQIDDRVLVQALYRWVIAGRSLLLQRLCEQRLKRMALRRLTSHYQTRATSQQTAISRFERERQTRASKLAIDRWRDLLNDHRQDARIAFEFEAPRIAQQAMSAVTARIKHIHQLHKWALDAEYYFCVVKFLKKWRAVTAATKRRKLHEAYAHVRRRSKMKLATSALQIWHSRFQAIAQAQAQAHSYGQIQLLHHGTRLFDHWRSQYNFFIDRQDQTTMEFDQRFAHNHFDMWTSKFRTQVRRHALASANAELRVSNIAFGWLHKLHLRIIELKGRESNAESLRRWYEKRHTHNLLRLWHERTAKRRDRPLQPPVFSSARARRRQDAITGEASDGAFAAANRAEEWTAFDEGFDVGDWIPGIDNVEASSTPMPGYLSTPSKRAARARGMARASTTPAGTPFAARLRSQAGRRGEFGRSGAGVGFAGSAFGAILESEPRTPGGESLLEKSLFSPFVLPDRDDKLQRIRITLKTWVASMRAILPGKPQARLQAISTAQWEGLRLVAYISGNGLMILSGPSDLIQTIYHEDRHALLAVTIDELTGKIATSSSTEVYVYRPYGREEGLPKWSLQFVIARQEQEPEDVALSWATDEEFLIGSNVLRLFQTATKDVEIWSRKLPRPVKLASFSHDASLIATTGRYDRLIKLWRRQASGADDTRFDYTYLPHPTAVTAIQWRRPCNREQASNHTLYSICGDQKLRIWATMNPHGVQGLQLWSELDMQASIQPRQPSPRLQSRDRFAFIIDSQEFAGATATAVERANKLRATSTASDKHHALEHIAEIAKSCPEICVILDRHGHMSAWGLENIGCKNRSATDIFNIAHVENFHLAFSKTSTMPDRDTRLVTLHGGQHHALVTLLAHHFDGRIEWADCRLDELFDPSPQTKRIHRKSLWTGHERPIKKIIRSASGKAVMSRTTDDVALVWRQGYGNSDVGLNPYSSLDCSEHIHRSWLLLEGEFVVNLHHHNISLWDARHSPASKIATVPFDIEGLLICLVQLPGAKIDTSIAHLAAVTARKRGIVWELVLPPVSQGIPEAQSAPAHAPSIKQFCTFDLGVPETLDFMLPVDPAGSAAWASSSLDTFARDIAISYSSDGRLRSWTAALNNDESTVDWLATSTVETCIDKPSLTSASSTRKAALADASRTGLTIWDMRSGQLEHREQYEDVDKVQDLDWSSTPDDQALLAVGFPHRVVILTQMRYNYMGMGPAWARIREIYIKDFTPHPIGDSTWLSSGNFLVGAGNQLFVYDKIVDSSDDMVSDLAVPVHKQGLLNLFDLVTFLNGPLPVFHPQFLSQCILAGKLLQVQNVVRGLHKALKFFTDGDELDSYVSLSLEDFITSGQVSCGTGKKGPGASSIRSLDEEAEVDLEEVAASLNECLTKISIPQLSSQQQMHLADMVECISTVEKHRRSLDDNAIRYLLFFRHHMIRKAQTPPPRGDITYREIVWAYHSASQDILIDLVTRQFQGRMLWGHTKESGLFMWMTDLNALRAQFEIIARNEYTKTDEKNPIDCSLYYLALRKKNVLVGLWRMAGWNREQASTQRLLSNNFQEARWKTAALKNAYALLGKRRFAYAAAFFLLAGNLQDAVNVCLHQLQDLQLAVAVTRVYEGDDGPVLRRLLQDKVLPQAASEGNRWLATWAFWMLGQRDMAVRSLISPIHTLLDRGQAPSMAAKSYLANDPALVVLYQQLRGKTLQTLKGASRIAPKEEWEFVIQNARLYDRMGCDLLALDLVRNWDFLVQPKELLKDEAPDPRKMLRRRSSLVVDDLSSSKSPTGMKSGLGKPPAQKVFEEPEANSLLDNFGF
ncbi:MAG: hypothetical protein Q9216_002831 [Gyalolechia sp. 2 TL-2023]